MRIEVPSSISGKFESNLLEMISIIIPVHNSSATLKRCLEAIVASEYPNFECIVVDDGSIDDSYDIAKRYATMVLRLTDGPFGPAYARNHGAEVARGTILFFVDADVVIHPYTLSKVAMSLYTNPENDAVFGSYDDDPEHRDFLSQYKNLFHHYVHQRGNEMASTFWAGCGAVRRDAFFEVGGFDEKCYQRPCIEDIELGHRLRTAGYRIELNKSIHGKHLKRWTYPKLVKSEIFDRGIPWTLLILRNRSLPNDLNLRLSQRLSALLTCLLLLFLGLNAVLYKEVLLPLLAGLFTIVLGYWDGDEGPLLDMRRARVKIITLALIGVVIGFTIYSNYSYVLLSFTPLLILVLARWLLPNTRLSQNQIYFDGIIISFCLALTLVLLRLPVLLIITMITLLILIMLLNHGLYAFFLQKRGLTFAMAVVPFHLLYYFYSIFSIAAGFIIHLWDNVMGPGLRTDSTVPGETP